jgi:hypothetical protein
MKNAEKTRPLRLFFVTVTLKKDSKEYESFDAPFICYAENSNDAETRIQKDLHSGRFKNTQYDSRNIIRISKVQLLSKEMYNSLKEVN